MWKKLSGLKKFYIKQDGKNRNGKMALLIDGPNMLRKEFNIDLDKIREALDEFGSVVIGRVYLNQYASDKLIEAIANQGYEPKVSAGDVDVEMAVDGTELIFNNNIDTIVYMTRDADFLPAIRKAKEYGKNIIIIGAEPGFSTAIQNIADYVIKIEDDFEFNKEKLDEEKKKKEEEIEHRKEEKREKNKEREKEKEKEKEKNKGSNLDEKLKAINWFKK